MKTQNAIIACAAIVLMGAVAVSHKVSAGEIILNDHPCIDAPAASLGEVKLPDSVYTFNWGISNKVIRPKR